MASPKRPAAPQSPHVARRNAWLRSHKTVVRKGVTRTRGGAKR